MDSCECGEKATIICPKCDQVCFCNPSCKSYKTHFARCFVLLKRLSFYQLLDALKLSDPRFQRLGNFYHIKARGTHPAYPARFAVADSYVDWNVPYPEYAPIPFTAPGVIANDCTVKPGGWADPKSVEGLDFQTRLSHEGEIKVDSTGRPINPRGRTGMNERGLLGKWGPNHAADPIVIRRNPKTSLIEMVAIKRKDTGEWAIPGGMVDPGEHVSATLRREFEEEAGNVPDDQKVEFRTHLDKLFASGRPIYKGYVDDPRNTDNAWMETVAMLFVCDETLAEFLSNLNAGDDAADVQWLCIQDSNTTYLNLYASHKPMVDLALQQLSF